MRNTILLILCLLTLTACSDREGATARSQQELRNAMQAIDTAQQGYIVGKLHSADSHAPVDLEAYRQKGLDEAAGELQKVMQDGSDEQRVAAAGLLADTQVAAAQYTAHKAMDNWAALARHSAVLIDQLLIIEDDATRAQSYTIDLNPLLDKLRDQQKANDVETAELEKEAQGLTDKTGQLKQEIDALRARSMAERADAEAYRSQAFGAAGATQDNLYGQASDAHASDIQAYATAQKRAADMQVWESRLALVNQRLDLRRGFSQSLGDQIKDIEKQQEDNAKQYAAAMEEKNEKIKALEDPGLTDFARAYKEQVDEPMGAAQKQALDAIATLSSVLGKTEGLQRHQLQVDLLVKQTVRASILAQHVYAASGYSRTLALLASPCEGVMPGVTSFKDASRQAADALGKLAESAKSNIAAAIKSADVRGDAKAAQFVSQLQTYAQNISDVAGSPATAPVQNSATSAGQ